MQGNDPDDFNANSPSNNVVAIEVSMLRTVLTVIQADPMNSGPYQCTAVSELGDQVAIASIDIVVQ